MATWKSAAYDGRYLQLDISESVNVVNNSSTLSWTLTSTGGASTYYTIDTTTVTINGNAHRVFCSRECYLQFRRKEADHE